MYSVMSRASSRRRGWCLVPYSASLAALIAGCGGNSSTAPASEITGAWVIEGFENKALPITTLTGLGSRRELVGGALRFVKRDTLVDEREFRNVGLRDTSSYADSARVPYSVSGNLVLIRRSFRAGTLSYVDTGTVAGNRMTLKVQFLDEQINAQKGTITYRRLQP
jgi:hypothetical protein